MCIRDSFRTFGDRPYLGRYSGYQAALAHERGDLDGAVVGCLLYTSDAADDLLCVDLGGRRIINKKKN